MEKIIAFSGTNAALTGEEALKARGVPVRVMARPNALGAQCGFCLRVNPADISLSIEVLTEAKLVIYGVYDLTYDSFGRPSYAIARDNGLGF